MSVKITGLDRITQIIEGAGDPEKLKEAFGKSCALVERSAKEKAPKDTGALRRSITSEVRDSGGEISGIVFTPLEYAPYIEFGTGLFAEKGGRQDVPWNYQDDEGNWHSTSGQKPQPFLNPALCENREQITRIIKEALTNG